MIKLLIICLSISLTFCNNFLCTEESELFFCNEVFQSKSISEKISQMIMVRVNGEFQNKDSWSKKNVSRLINDKKIGGLITYTGSIHGTFYNIKEFQEMSDIPLFIAADYERGVGQFTDGTLFPSNMAIAATNNTQNSFKQGEITAIEAKALGVNMVFAPVLDINNNYNNPIINFRSYSDNPQTVIDFSLPFIDGLQSKKVIACGKHFPGHGDTDTDSHTSLPVINKSLERIFSNELLPFKTACQNGLQSIMVAHVLFPNLDDKNPATFSKKITNNILREQWEYDGLIITDALEMGALTNFTWHGESAVKAVEAGADIILLPIDADEAINSIIQAVKSGRISEERINQSFNRIIDAKHKAGLFDNYSKTWEEVEEKIKIHEHTKISKKIARESITLVKNNNDIVPINPLKYKKITHLILSTDEGVKSRFKSYSSKIKKLHGNVTEVIVNEKLTKLGTKDVINKIKKSDLVIVSMLIRIKMDKGISTIDDSHSNLIKKISKLNIPILGLSFGSPYLPSYKNLDAYICTYGYGSITINAAFDAMFGRQSINGKLPVRLNDEFINGHGLNIKKISMLFDKTLNIELSSFSFIESAINDSIFPGAQLFVSKGNQIISSRGFGSQSFDKNSLSVDNNTIYDLASLTKVLSTTSVVMKLIEKKRLSLNHYLSDYYPEFNSQHKKNVTIKHLLNHTAGLKPYIEFYKKGDFDKEKIINNIINLPLDYEPGSKFIYSDLGMILLYDIIEKVSSKKLENLSDNYFYKPLKMKSTFFNPPSNFKKLIAPTEDDKYFRNKLLKGDVHDENAYIMGGVSGHAGLFSNAEDISSYSKMMINQGYANGVRYFSKNIIKRFTEKSETILNSDYVLGWDTPSQNGKSSAGDYFSEFTYGHLGFTGTSMWLDPENEIIVILLTNRVHPTRDKKNIGRRMYDFRRDFHNSIVKEILSL